MESSRVNRKVLQSFLTDALKMNIEAFESVKGMTVHAQRGNLIPTAEINQFYRLVHTLKGTASMLPEARAIVRALHDLEDHLSGVRLEVLSRMPGRWLPLAKKALTQTQKALLEIHAQSKAMAQASEQSRVLVDKGMLISRFKNEDNEGSLLWFAMSSLTRVMNKEEVGDRGAVCMNGSWVPVVMDQDSLFCVGVISPAGQLILGAVDILGFATWEQAQKQGARDGVEALSELVQAGKNIGTLQSA